MHTKKVGGTVPDEMDGIRLDRALEAFLPGASLRYRRRLWDHGRVLVNGVEKGRSYKVRAGMTVRVEYGGEKGRDLDRDLPFAVCSNFEFGAVFKPGGVHSAAVAGKPGPSVEEMLPELFPGTHPLLLNRLDYLTSGLLMVAFDPSGAERFRVEENAGGVDKLYLAVVHGRDAFPSETVLKGRLNTENRRTTRLLAEDNPDPLRWTEVRRIRVLEMPKGLGDAPAEAFGDVTGEATLIEVKIRKGARHQIRAHLAGAGHSIIGDPLYGNGGENETMYLHHWSIRFPGFEAAVPPKWDLAGLDDLGAGPSQI